MKVQSIIVFNFRVTHTFYYIETKNEFRQKKTHQQCFQKLYGTRVPSFLYLSLSNTSILQ